MLLRHDICQSRGRQSTDMSALHMQPPPQASPGFLRMLEAAMHAEEQGMPFGGKMTHIYDFTASHVMMRSSHSKQPRGCDHFGVLLCSHFS